MPKNIDQIFILSIGFFLLFTSFMTAQSLAVQVMKDNDFGSLGHYSLCLLYGFFAFSCLISLPVVKMLGAKMSLVIGTLCYTFYVACFILPVLKTENPHSNTFILNRQLIQIAILVSASINGFEQRFYGFLRVSLFPFVQMKRTKAFLILYFGVFSKAEVFWVFF